MDAPLQRGASWALTLCCPFSSSGYAYTRSEAGNELDMDLGEEDVEEKRGAGDTESGSIEEDRCVNSALRLGTACRLQAPAPRGEGLWLLWGPEGSCWA